MSNATFNDADMEIRIEKLEMAVENTRQRLAGVETRLTSVETKLTEVDVRLIRVETRLDTFATREDLHKGLHAITWRILGGCTLMVSAVYFIARHVN